MKCIDIFTCILQEGRADCLANEEGDRQIASALAFHGDEEVSFYFCRSEFVLI